MHQFQTFLSPSFKKGEQAQLSFLSDSSSLSHTASWLPSSFFRSPSEAGSHPSIGFRAAYIDERLHCVRPANPLAIFLPSNLPPSKNSKIVLFKLLCPPFQLVELKAVSKQGLAEISRLHLFFWFLPHSVKFLEYLSNSLVTQYFCAKLFFRHSHKTSTPDFSLRNA